MKIKCCGGWDVWVGKARGVGVVYDVLLQLRLYDSISIIMLIREAYYF